MVKLLVNHKPLSIPESWTEMPSSLYQRIVAEWEPEKPLLERDRVKLFAMMTDTTYSAIVKSTDYMLEGTLYACTSFVYEDRFTFDKGSVPTTIRVGDCLVDIPKNIGKLTIGQNIFVRQLLAGATDERTVYTKIVAIYLQPFLDGRAKDGKIIKGDFDYTRAMEIEPLIGELPITEVFPIAFFLRKRLRLFGTSWLNRCVLKILRRIRNVSL